MKMRYLLPAAALLLSGCVSTLYRGENFPATNEMKILSGSQNIPSGYRIIGRGRASGEYSGTSDAELRCKLRKLGMQHGADIMLVSSGVIVPDGNAVTDAEENFIAATDDPDQVSFDTTMQKILNASSGSRERFLRIMYAIYLRRKP